MNEGWDVYMDPFKEFERQGLDLSNPGVCKYKVFRNDTY